MKYYIDKPDSTIQEIIRNCYPGYNGKKISISSDIPSSLDSYWSEGSKNYYCFYHLSEKKVIPVHTNHPAFEKNRPRDLNKLPDQIVIVEHTIFCGKDFGITIYVNVSDLTPLLPSTDSISRNEAIVLTATRSLKNTYGGESNIRFKRANETYKISKEDWDNCQKSLVNKGFLDKRFSITANGRNALNSFSEIIRIY